MKRLLIVLIIAILAINFMSCTKQEVAKPKTNEKAYVRLEVVNENGSKDYSKIMVITYQK